jgi:two-component system, cell cycle sensor histidine kinase and response regulator CckA
MPMGATIAIDLCVLRRRIVIAENAATCQRSKSAAFTTTRRSQTQKLTILLVEDEAFVRNVTSEVLRSFGYAVIPTCNAEEAMDAFHRSKGNIQLVLTDVVMPGSNGRRLASQLKNISPDLEVIVTSGYPEAFTPEDQAASRSLHYLPKPYSVLSLMQKVGEIMEGQQRIAKAAGR